MANEILQFMDKQNAYVLADALFAKANIRLSERIVKEVSAVSTDKQMPSARLLYKLVATQTAADTDLVNRVDTQDPAFVEQTAAIESLQDAQAPQDEKLTVVESKLSETSDLVDELNHFTIQTVTGAIETVTEPSGEVFYLQRDSETDRTWMIYLYVGGQWINVGDTELDLSHLWSKDEVEELKEALDIHNAEGISEDRIAAIVDQEFANTAVDFSPFKVITTIPTLGTPQLTAFPDGIKYYVNATYNSDEVTLSGTTAALQNTGDHYVIFTPNDGYMWPDGTRDALSLKWTAQ